MNRPTTVYQCPECDEHEVTGYTAMSAAGECGILSCAACGWQHQDGDDDLPESFWQTGEPVVYSEEGLNQMIERVWLLSRNAKPGGPDEPRRRVEGVALSEEAAYLWRAESGEYDNQAEEVLVWHPAMMTVSGDVDLDDPETAEAMEDIRQASTKKLRRLSIDKLEQHLRNTRGCG